MQQLRDYQVRGLEQLRTSIQRGNRRSLFVLPVGGGKTTCFAEVTRKAASAGWPVLVLAHRKELIDQASARLDSFGIDHGVIMASHTRRKPGHLVQVASIQTLHNRPKPEARIVIVDEAHRAKAATWESTLAFYPDAFVIGFTATPWRLDGRGLGDIFTDLVVASTPRELVSAGWLTPITGFGYDRPDLSEVKRGRGDYQEAGLASAMSKTQIVGNIIEQWQARASDLSTVVFAVNIEHSMRLRDEFRTAGVTAEHLDGTTARGERERILAAVADGSVQIICNVNVLTEGTDIPRLKCCVLARPTLSLSLYIQMVGRVRRPWNGLVARLHDHAGCLQQHLLPDADREYSLDATPKRRTVDVDALRQCKACFAIYDPRDCDACPSCGYQNPKAGPRGGPEHVLEGEVIEFDNLEFREVRGHEVADNEKMRETYKKMLAQAQQNGYKSGWAFHKFKDRFGVVPHWSWNHTEV